MNWFFIASLTCATLFFPYPGYTVRLQQVYEVFDIDPVKLQIQVGNTLVHV